MSVIESGSQALHAVEAYDKYFTFVWAEFIFSETRRTVLRIVFPLCAVKSVWDLSVFQVSEHRKGGLLTID